MFSSISGASGGSGSPAAAQARSQAVDRFFKKADANRDGKITKDELTQVLESDTVETGSGDQGPSVDQIFKSLDSGNKGYITRQDVADGLDQLAPQTPPGDAAAAAGGGGSGRGGARGAGGGGGGAVTVAYDPRDTNQDGKVSMQEDLDYALKQYTMKTDSMQQSQSVTWA